jgi:hypothetical protein
MTRHANRKSFMNSSISCSLRIILLSRAANGLVQDFTARPARGYSIASPAGVGSTSSLCTSTYRPRVVGEVEV